MGRFDILSFGSSTRDVFVLVDKDYFKKNLVFKPGSKVEIKDMGFFTGGGATNTSVGFARLGLKAGIVSVVGKDQDGNEIKNELLREGVDCTNLVVNRQKKTSYSVILTGFGKDRVILNYTGATVALENNKNINWQTLEADWFLVSSLHGKGKLLKKIFLYAKKNGIKVAFNPGQKEIALGMKKLSPFLRQSEVLLLNSMEALKLTGHAGIEKNLAILCGMAKTVAITDGKNAAFVAGEGKVFSKKPFNIKVLDTSGAGDAFNSGFAGALAKGHGLKTALDWGVANASSVVQFLGTKNVLLTESGIENFLKKHKK